MPKPVLGEIHRAPLKHLRLKVDRTDRHVDFEMRKHLERLKKTAPARQEAHAARIRMAQQMENAGIQEALQGERKLIEGAMSSRRHYPPHLQARLKEIQGLLTSGGNALR